MFYFSSKARYFVSQIWFTFYKYSERALYETRRTRTNCQEIASNRIRKRAKDHKTRSEICDRNKHKHKKHSGDQRIRTEAVD